MLINKLMIAGVDNNTSIEKLKKLSKKFPFVEWGVLFSKSSMGKARYPNLEYINELCQANIGEMSAHFCGAYSREILEKGDHTEYLNLNEKFVSVQLNYNFKYRADKWTYEFLHEIFRQSQEELNPDIIIQMNKSNWNTLINYPKDFKELRVLHDASGGRGTEIKQILRPRWDNYTGYAGGLNDSNIERIAEHINKIPTKTLAWLDLESGARDEKNKFDFKKVESILIKVQPYILKKDEK